MSPWLVRYQAWLAVGCLCGEAMRHGPQATIMFLFFVSLWCVDAAGQ
jgi:hypothetical protein